MPAKLMNPLDELFQTAEPAADMTEYQELPEAALAPCPADPPPADPGDADIDKKIDAVYDAAFETFQQQMQYVEIVEPRYAARNAEVAAHYLSIALNAASTKARVRADRKRASTFSPYAGKRETNVVVASREDIMRMISIDAETKELK